MLTVDENEDHEELQVKIQAFEDKINAEGNTPGSLRRYSLDQVSKEERKGIRFNRYKFFWLIFRIYTSCLLLVLLSHFYEVVFKYLLPTAKFIHSAFIIQSSLLY